MKQELIQAIPDKLFVFLKKFGWYGHFKTWSEAKKETTGYDARDILERVKSSLLKVKNGEAIYERDSVLFDKIEYSWELLAILMWIAAQKNGELRVIDFGGSLGSTYYQNKRFLDTLDKVSWNIIEQPDFVKVGIEHFQDDVLRFYLSIDDCYSLSSQPVDAILFSCVLPYLEDSYKILKEAVDHNIKYIIIDRTGFTPNQEKSRITVQKVPSKIYKASYPCRFFNEEEFLTFFKNNNYELVIEFDALDKVNIPSKYKGFMLKKKENA